MSNNLTNLTLFDKIKNLAIFYKNHLTKINQINQQHKKSNDAGNELYNTLTENFEKLFVKIDNLDVSDKILDEFLSIINEESFIEVLLEMYKNLPDNFDHKIIKKLEVIEIYKEKFDAEEGISSNSLSSESNSDNEIFYPESTTNCRRSTRLKSKRNKYINNIEVKKNDSNYDKNYEYSDLDDEDNDGYDNISIQKVILDPVIQEKLELYIEKDLKLVSDKAIDTFKVSNKVKEISSYLGISQRVIGPIVAKLSIGAFSDLMIKIKDWNNLKERMQDVFRRLYAWIINKDAVLFIHSLCPKKLEFYGNEKILIPKPSYFWLNCDETPIDEIERCITPPVVQLDNTNEEIVKLGEFQPSLRVNKYIRTVESDPTYEKIFERTGKTYEFQNKNIVLEDIKYMTTKTFKFKGFLNTLEICKEIRKHLNETNCSQRNFAENILGMSQGSASDLLTKPKEWHGLTRRGREPYIKMRAYLDTYEGLKDELKNILEREEKEQLEKLKKFHKNKQEKSGKDFNTKSLHNVLNKFSKPSTSTQNTIKDGNESSINIINQNVKEIIKKTEKLFQHKENFSVFSKSSDSLKKNNSQMTTDNKIIFNSPLFLNESFNTMTIATEMKTLLDECKVTPAMFAENFMMMKPQDFHRILTAPRAWNLSSLEDRDAYKKMKLFLNNQELVNCFKENGFNAFPKILKISVNTNTPINNEKKVCLLPPSKTIDSSSTLCNSKVLKLCSKKRPMLDCEDDLLSKKHKLDHKESEEKIIENCINNEINSFEKIVNEGINSIKLANTNVTKQNPLLVPFNKSIPIINNQQTITKCFDDNFEIKKEIENDSKVENNDSISKTLINDTNIQIKEEFIKSDSDIIDCPTSSDDSLNSLETQLSKQIKEPQFFRNLHENSFKPIHKENITAYDINTCHAKIIKNNNKEELLIDTAELEILYLAWTYNPNPQSVMKNYLSQMTVLPIETIETWYHTFNKLKGNYLRTAQNSLTYRENLRKIVLSTTTRKKYLAITDLVFKQLFSNKLAELINHNP
uniref:CUT domain-containing protein n=1 Tax=Strongyloides stercoralis TaxID=6248 RepID=A0A0K0DZH4_STRER